MPYVIESMISPKTIKRRGKPMAHHVLASCAKIDAVMVAVLYEKSRVRVQPSQTNHFLRSSIRARHKSGL